MFQIRLIVGFTCEAQKTCLAFHGEYDKSRIYKKAYCDFIKLLSVNEMREYNELLGAFKNQFNEIDLKAFQLKTARNTAFHFASEDSKLSAYTCGAELIYQDIGTEYETPVTYTYEQKGNSPTPNTFNFAKIWASNIVAINYLPGDNSKNTLEKVKMYYLDALLVVYKYISFTWGILHNHLLNSGHIQEK